MEEDIVGVIFGVFILVVVMALFTVAAVAAVPATVILGGGYLWWRRHNNSPVTQARRQIEELRELHTAIGNKVRLTGGKLDIGAIVREAADRAEYLSERDVPDVGFDALYAGARQLIELTGTGALPKFDTAALTQSEQLRSEFRQQLYAIDETYQYGSNPSEAFSEYLGNCLGEILGRMPKGLSFEETAPLSTRLLDLMPDNKGVIERLVGNVYHLECSDIPLRPLQDEYDRRLARIAGKSIDELNKNPHRMPKPAEDKRPPIEVATDYLAGSPFLTLLLQNIAYHIPGQSRMEHMHVLAGSGHGKTQLLQSFIKADLDALIAHAEDPDDTPPRSIVVIDSQGDLIRNIVSRQVFAPDEPLGDRLVLIDPTDVIHPPALNMFDVGQDRFDELPPHERTTLYNGTIELYVYLFSELLGAAMTSRQATLFRFLAQLLLAIPGATLQTFLAVLENDEESLSHVEKLDAVAQQFFATQYVGDEFKQTKKQIAWRLWGLIANPALSSMFNSPKSKIDLDAELQRGTIILVNTAKDMLKSEGSKLFGRFWVALLAQAAIKRAQIPASERVTTHVYLDEAHEIVDEKVEEILNQARKYKIGLTISHQNLNQLKDNATRASIAASTAIKMVGGASDKDARAYAGDLRTSAEHVLSTRKVDGVSSEFVTFVKNHLEHGMTLSVPFGQLEALPKCSSEERQALREENHERYCHQPTKQAEPDERDAPEEPDETAKDNPAKGDEGEPYEFKLGDPEDL